MTSRKPRRGGLDFTKPVAATATTAAAAATDAATATAPPPKEKLCALWIKPEVHKGWKTYCATIGEPINSKASNVIADFLDSVGYEVPKKPVVELAPKKRTKRGPE